MEDELRESQSDLEEEIVLLAKVTKLRTLTVKNGEQVEVTHLEASSIGQAPRA